MMIKLITLLFLIPCILFSKENTVGFDLMLKNKGEGTFISLNYKKTTNIENLLFGIDSQLLKGIYGDKLDYWGDVSDSYRSYIGLSFAPTIGVNLSKTIKNGFRLYVSTGYLYLINYDSEENASGLITTFSLEYKIDKVSISLSNRFLNTDILFDDLYGIGINYSF